MLQGGEGRESGGDSWGYLAFDSGNQYIKRDHCYYDCVNFSMRVSTVISSWVCIFKFFRSIFPSAASAGPWMTANGIPFVSAYLSWRSSFASCTGAISVLMPA